MTKILFSLPVHENNANVRDTIANAKKYNPGCTIVLHVSAAFSDFDRSVKDIPSVLMNRVRFHTKHSQASHVPIHFTNYQFALENSVDFDYVVILHTSEMYVKFGAVDYIKNYEYSLWFDQEHQPRSSSWPPFYLSKQNRVFRELFDSNDSRNYLGNLIEGNFWHRDLFELMVQWTKQHYSILDMAWNYPSEECYLPTLAHHLSKTKDFGHPVNAFHHREHYLKDPVDITDIRENKDIVFWQPNNWVYRKIPFPSNNIFSIKRVNRDINDPIRQYINSLDQ